MRKHQRQFFWNSYASHHVYAHDIFICSNFQLEIMLLHTCEHCLDKGGVLGSNVDLMVSLVFHLQFTLFLLFVPN